MPTHELIGRHANVVLHVARFQQLAASHLNELLFSNLATRTMCDRTLRRLVDLQYLYKIERRTVGGARGGSGQYCYCLGRAGWPLYKDGPWRVWRTVNYHALTVADSYLHLLRLARAGKLRINHYAVESEAYRKYGDYELHPDWFVDVALLTGLNTKLNIEVDMGTEGSKHITAKLERYYFARQESPDVPPVIWVTPDEWRRQELQYIVDHGPEDAGDLFHVCTLAQFPGLFV